MDQSFEILDVGDKVRHPKFGVGTVMNRSGDNENQKVTVKFGAEFGEKKLVTKFANMKRISERPTLQATAAAPGAFPGAAAAAVAAVPITKLPAKSLLGDDEEDEEEPEFGEEGDDDDDDEAGDEEE